MNDEIAVGNICKRLFIGVPLDQTCQGNIDNFLQDIRHQRDDIHWAAGHNRHLTLAFLGETPAEHLSTLQGEFAEAYGEQAAFTFSLTQLSRFPDPQGRIIAVVGAPSDELMLLYEKTRLLLQRCAISFSEREYRPHITLGRIRHARQVKEVFQQPLALMLQVDRVNLYESISTDEGRLYRVLAQARFLL